MQRVISNPVIISALRMMKSSIVSLQLVGDEGFGVAEIVNVTSLMIYDEAKERSDASDLVIMFVNERSKPINALPCHLTWPYRIIR